VAQPAWSNDREPFCAAFSCLWRNFERLREFSDGEAAAAVRTPIRLMRRTFFRLLCPDQCRALCGLRLSPFMIAGLLLASGQLAPSSFPCHRSGSANARVSHRPGNQKTQPGAVSQFVRLALRFCVIHLPGGESHDVSLPGGIFVRYPQITLTRTHSKMWLQKTLPGRLRTRSAP